MFNRMKETVTFVAGVFLVLFGSILVFTPGIANAGPSEQRDPFTDSACLSCHTDQQKLREITETNETADEPEESSLSSGPG